MNERVKDTELKKHISIINQSQQDTHYSSAITQALRDAVCLL